MFRNRQEVDDWIIKNGWKLFLDLMVQDGQIKFMDDENKKYLDRENFRKALAEAGFAGFTTYSSPILTAYDMVHCPELRK